MLRYRLAAHLRCTRGAAGRRPGGEGGGAVRRTPHRCGSPLRQCRPAARRVRACARPAAPRPGAPGGVRCRLRQLRSACGRPPPGRATWQWRPTRPAGSTPRQARSAGAAGPPRTGHAAPHPGTPEGSLPRRPAQRCGRPAPHRHAAPRPGACEGPPAMPAGPGAGRASRAERREPPRKPERRHAARRRRAAGVPAPTGQRREPSPAPVERRWGRQVTRTNGRARARCSPGCARPETRAAWAHAARSTRRRVPGSGRRLRAIAQDRCPCRPVRGDRPRRGPLVIAYLAGRLPQGRIGVGWSTLKQDVPPADHATLTVADTDAALTAVALATGPGSRAERQGILRGLMAAATAAEQRFLVRLLTGEVRQGALDAVALEGVAAARACPRPTCAAPSCSTGPCRGSLRHS